MSPNVAAVVAALALVTGTPTARAQSASRAGRAPVVSLDTRWPSRTAAGFIIFNTTERAEVESNSDGWVVIAPVGFSGDGEPYPPRRMFVTGADARTWAAAIRTAVSHPVGHLARSDSASLRLPVLGTGGAWFEGERGYLPTDGPPGANFRFILCEQRYHSYNLDDGALLRIADVVDRAGRDALASTSTARAPTLRRAYYAAEVGCPARPRRDNALPSYPKAARHDGAGSRPYEVGVRFVVDTSGRVEPSSVTVLPGAPNAFAAAARTTVAYWRYSPAHWGRWPVRQVVHTVLAFDPVARSDAAILHETAGRRDEPRVLFEPASDGSVRVTHGSWDADGHLSGLREWFAPDSIRRWIGFARRQLAADLVDPKYARGTVGPRSYGVGSRSATLLAGYTPPPMELDPATPRDTLLLLRAQLFGCTNRYYAGELIDSSLLARVSAAADAAQRIRRRPRPVASRVYERGEVACPATMIASDAADPRFPGAQLPKPGPYPQTMLPTQARAEVMASFVVDTSGRVEPRSLIMLRGNDPRAAAALRAGIARYDFTAARRSGRPVRQRVIRTWVFVPPPSCETADLGLECRRIYRESRPAAAADATTATPAQRR